MKGGMNFWQLLAFKIVLVIIFAVIIAFAWFNSGKITASAQTVDAGQYVQMAEQQ